MPTQLGVPGTTQMQCPLDMPEPHSSPALPPQAMPVLPLPLPGPPTLESASTLLSLACISFSSKLSPSAECARNPTLPHCPPPTDSQLSSQRDCFRIPVWSGASCVPHLPHSSPSNPSLSHSSPNAPSPVVCLAPPLLSSHLLPGLQPTSPPVPAAQWSPSGHRAFAQAVASAWKALSSDLAR